MKYDIHLVKPTPTKKRNYITLSEYEVMNKQGFNKLLTALIKNMVKYKYKS
jgi:hypothetical protein